MQWVLLCVCCCVVCGGVLFCFVCVYGVWNQSLAQCFSIAVVFHNLLVSQLGTGLAFCWEVCWNGVGVPAALSVVLLREAGREQLERGTLLFYLFDNVWLGIVCFWYCAQPMVPVYNCLLSQMRSHPDLLVFWFVGFCVSRKSVQLCSPRNHLPLC